jgi:hypothetical protein
MSDLVKDLVGTWNVAFKQYRWTYTFTAGGMVTWRDIWGGQTGTGRWELSGSKVAVIWRNSETKESWNVPINPDNQSGNIDADYASGQFTSTKDKARFDAVSPEGQQDAFACWAACLAWYTRALPDVQTTSQQSIIMMSDPNSWASNGSISLNGIMSISLPSVFLNRSRIGAGQLEACIRAKPFPLLLAFATGPMGGHVNVIHRFDEHAGTVMAMEPWFPDPATNPNYSFDGSVFSNKSTGDPFKFTGKHTSRPLSYYTSKPLSGQFVIGYNSKYSGTF